MHNKLFNMFSAQFPNFLIIIFRFPTNFSDSSFEYNLNVAFTSALQTKRFLLTLLDFGVFHKIYCKAQKLINFWDLIVFSLYLIF